MNRIFPKLNLTTSDFLAILLCSIPAFYLLGTPAIYIWDEAVYANASFDMSEGASWWVPVHPEYNTKPPLVLWLQSIFLWVIPSPEWAVRLPSALAVMGILLMLQSALKRWGFDFWSRLLVIVCFVGHEGFIRHHISRTADLDAVMTFFVVSYCLVVLDAIQQKRWTDRHMFYFFLALVCAFYSKSIGGWLMLAPLGLVWLLSPLRNILWSGKFLAGAFLSLGICLFYYLSREILQPGFLQLVGHSEYLRMFRNVMPWHEHGPGYYFNNFTLLKTFTPWIYVLAGISIYIFFVLRNQTLRGHLLKWMILGYGYMMVITIPAVKLEWYDAPAYPFFAMIMGVTLGHLLLLLPSKWRPLALIPIAFILWRKLHFIHQDVFPRHPFEHEGYILRQAEMNINTKVMMKVETPEHQLQLDFYRKIILKEKGIEVEVIDSVDKVISGDKIIVSQQEHLLKMQEIFLLDTIQVWDRYGYIINVLGRK